MYNFILYVQAYTNSLVYQRNLNVQINDFFAVCERVNINNITQHSVSKFYLVQTYCHFDFVKQDAVMMVVVKYGQEQL